MQTSFVVDDFALSADPSVSPLGGRAFTTRVDHIGQLGGGPYGEVRVRWTPWLRTIAGLRGDVYRATVESDLAANSGTVERAIASPSSPCLSAPSTTPTSTSTPAAVSTATTRAARRSPSTRRAGGWSSGCSRSCERGASTSACAPTASRASRPRSPSSASTSTRSSSSRATPARPRPRDRPAAPASEEAASFYRLSDRVTLDADLAYSHGRFTGSGPVGDHIPGAIEGVVSAGVTWDGLGARGEPRGDAGGFLGALRLRYFGPRPLIEDASVSSRSSSLLNARFGCHLGSGLDLSLDVFNLLDREVSDTDYFYASRLPGEPAAGVDDVHFRPAEPRSVRLTAAWRL